MDKNIYQLKNGIKYKIRPYVYDKDIVDEVWVHKHYTPKGFEINKNDLILDIGAHIGAFSIFASKLARRGKVFSFEPAPKNFRMLKNNVELNKIRNIVLYNKAVSDKKDKKTFFISVYNPGGNTFYPHKGDITKKIKVNTVSLPDIFDKNKISRVNFLKIDCEGAEYEILFNCPKDILGKIDKIVIECHNTNKNKQLLLLKNFLENNNFEVRIQRGDKNSMTMSAPMIFAKK